MTDLAAHTEQALEDLAESLQIPTSRYESAERSYKSVADWLCRDQSSLKHLNPQVYIQGSFRLGTAIRPVSEQEDYDLDIVCELSASKAKTTQSSLKTSLGNELKGYAESKSMEAAQEGRRCWTLVYADGAQFHMDALPAIPDAAGMRLLLEQRALDAEWSGTAIAITDIDHKNYERTSEEWPHSNPKGYANWFHSRMAPVFESRRMAMALDESASVEDIPEYRVRTPLQHAIQILKRHRDMMFAKRPDDKPISIIISTLSAHAYEQETSIASALFGILDRMDSFIEDRQGESWISNPTDGAENFADRWQLHPERKKAFYSWLAQARQDFKTASLAKDREAVLDNLNESFGENVIGNAKSYHRKSKSTGFRRLMERTGLAKLTPPHKQRPPWKIADGGQVHIVRATSSMNGFRQTSFSSGSTSLPRGAALEFHAKTDVPPPYDVFWQVVNTGSEATSANQLRGGFDQGTISEGGLIKKENTKYAGQHSIECFIVKNGYLVASSGQFIVNIGSVSS